MYKVKRMAFLKDRIALIVLLVITSFTGSIAQSWHKTDLGIITDINSVTVEARLYSPSTVRILKHPEGKSITKESLSVIKTPQKTEFSLRQSGNYFVLETKSLKIEIDRETGKISFLTLSSKPLLSEKENSTSFTDFNDNGKKLIRSLRLFYLTRMRQYTDLVSSKMGK
jgi:alpha-D-xyloside xylohydrolase